MISPKPIASETEYEAALARIETIFQARPGTPEGEEFDLLARLIEDYEAIHYPIGTPTEAEARQFRAEQMGSN